MKKIISILLIMTNFSNAYLTLHQDIQKTSGEIIDGSLITDRLQ